MAYRQTIRSYRPDYSDDSMRQEITIGSWRRSVKTWGFWWRTLLSFGLYTVLLWNRNQITVTTRRVTQRRGGILAGNETSVIIPNITDVSIDIPVLGALLGFGNVIVQSAGSSSAEIRFNGIAQPQLLKDVIFDLQDGRADDAAKRILDERLYKNARKSGQQSSDPAYATPTTQRPTPTSSTRPASTSTQSPYNDTTPDDDGYLDKTPAASGDPNADLFQQAQQLWRDGQRERAIGILKTLAAQGYEPAIFTLEKLRVD